MSQGMVTEYLVSLIAKQVEESSLVVWYDPGGDYRDLAACIEVPGASIARHDGSFFKLRRDIDSQNSDTHQIIGRSNSPREFGHPSIIGRSNLRGHRLSTPRCAPGPRSSGRSSRVRDHLTGEFERFAPSTRPGPRVERARRPLSSSSESVMEMSVEVSESRADGLQKGHSGRLLALEPVPRAACRGIDKQARAPRRLLEQPTEAAHRFHPVFSHKHLMNHDKLLRRLRSSRSRSGFAVSMARSCSVGSTGSRVVSSRGGKTLSPSQGDLVVGPLLGDVRSIAEHEMKVIAHHGIATNLDGEEPC